MGDKKIIAVVGATGAQGGGLVRAILGDPSGGFAVRALTRDVNSEKAKELAKLGAEVVAADVDDVESLKKAFAGAYGAYCVTFFWAHFSPEKEIAEAAAMAQAAKDAGAQARDLVHARGHPEVGAADRQPHADAAGQVQGRRTSTPRAKPTTSSRTSASRRRSCSRRSTGTTSSTSARARRRARTARWRSRCRWATRSSPASPPRTSASAPTGSSRRGREYIGKTVGIAGEHLTGAQMAAALTKALGREVRYNDVSPDVYRSFGFPGADDLGNMFQFKRDFDDEYCGARSVEFSRSLNPGLQTFDAVAGQERQAHSSRVSEVALALTRRGDGGPEKGTALY